MVERQLPKLNVEGSIPFTRFADRSHDEKVLENSSCFRVHWFALRRRRDPDDAPIQNRSRRVVGPNPVPLVGRDHLHLHLAKIRGLPEVVPTPPLLSDLSVEYSVIGECSCGIRIVPSRLYTQANE